MSRSNRGLALVTVAAILAVGFAGYEWHEAALARVAERAWRARGPELEARLRMAEQNLRQTQARPAAAAPASARAGAPVAAAPGRPAQSRMLWFATHPEARVRYLKDFRDQLEETYGPVFDALHLPPEQIEKVKDLLTQRQDKNLTLTQTTAASGYEPGSAALVDMNDGLTRANNAAIKAVVGNDAYQQIHQYLRETAVVPLVSNLASAMVGLNEPLTADQQIQLTATLATSSQRRPNTAAIPNTVNWEQAMAGAQTILSPSQLSAFTLIQQQDQGRQQITAMERALMAPAK